MIQNNPSKDNLERFLKTYRNDINYRDREGNTSLHYAVMNGNEDAVTLLLENGAITNIHNKMGNTPIFYAINNDIPPEENIIIQLLNHGATVDILYDNTSYLMDFLYIGRDLFDEEDLVYILKLMIDKCSVEFLDTRYIDTEYVILRTSSTVLELLTDSDFIEDMNFNEILILLINKGIDINSEYYDSNKFFENICSNGNTEIFDIVIERINKKFLGIVDNELEMQHTVLNGPIYNGHVDIIERLLERGCDPNKFLNEESPLIKAVKSMRNNTDILDILLKYGADVNYKDIFGNTALFYAKNTNTLNKLVLYGANVNELNNKYHSPLYYAIENYRHDLVRAILNFGPVIDVHDLISKGAPTILTHIPIYGVTYPYPDFARETENLTDDERRCLYEIAWSLIVEYITPYL